MLTLNDTNYLVADIAVQTNAGYDIERQKYIQRVKFETQSYLFFQNTIAMLFSHKENNKFTLKTKVCQLYQFNQNIESRLSFHR